MTWSPPDPLPVIAASEAATQLGVARAQGARLAATGMLGPLHRTPGGSLFADTPVIERLGQRVPRTKAELPSALVLRLGPPQREGDETQDRWFGFHVSMTTQQVQESALRWWPVRDAEELSARRVLIVVSVATFPAWVGRISSTKARSGRVAFAAEPDSGDDAQQYLSSRLNFQRGPLVDRVNLD